MGIDLLDVVFRLEKAFAVRIPRGDLEPLFARRQPPDLVVGDLIPFVLNQLANPTRAIPRHPAPLTPLTDYLDRVIPCMTCTRNLRDLPRTAYCPHCGTPALDSQIWLRIRQVLEDALGVPSHDIHPHSLLIRDLGCA